MLLLGVNIDHVATLRQTRYRNSDLGEPDPVLAAHEAQLGGADIITIHLREDRRHVRDRDLMLLVQTCRVRINLEMAATDEMVQIARASGVQMATLVPEGRQEVTTEGGLDVRGQAARLRGIVDSLRAAGIAPAAFIDADLTQIDAARACGFYACEIHTGPYAEAFARAGGDITRPELSAALGQLAVAGAAVGGAGMRFHAGHALNYANVGRVASLPGLCELHIGHAIVSRAVFVGLREAVAQMKAAMVL
ncbi:MAG: pyridoxine 5'-phosphate synthase [Phycisphaerales bacterium]